MGELLDSLVQITRNKKVNEHNRIVHNYWELSFFTMIGFGFIYLNNHLLNNYAVHMRVGNLKLMISGVEAKHGNT